jgi:hypothetical protein
MNSGISTFFNFLEHLINLDCVAAMHLIKLFDMVVLSDLVEFLMGLLSHSLEINVLDIRAHLFNLRMVVAYLLD